MPGEPTILPLVECDDLAFCGGKAINLGRMLRAGLPVPDGFVISTVAYRRSPRGGGELPESLAEEIAAAYRKLGSPAVAVRSSTTAEDLAEASMAGQCETLLDVSGEQALIEAVRHCWQSIDSQRLQSYLAKQGIRADSVAMAVAVVSGMVQPDVVVLDRHSGEEKDYSRYVVHWEFRETMKEFDTEIVVQRALEKYPGERPRIITDNGPQFIARDFKGFIRMMSLTHVRTSPYYPQSNGKLERWHGSIKRECIRPACPASLEEALRLVSSYVDEYNHRQLHSALGYITPADKLNRLEPVIFAERDRKRSGSHQTRSPPRRGRNKKRRS